MLNVLFCSYFSIKRSIRRSFSPMVLIVTNKVATFVAENSIKRYLYMKKIFAKVAMCLAIGSMGLVTTSCGDDEVISAIIQELITNLIGQRGEVYNYQASGMVQKLYKASADGGYVNGAAAAKFNALIPVTVNNNTADIVIPAMNVDGINMSQVTISGLVLTAGTACTTMSMSDEGVGVEGTATINGNVYNVTNLYIDTANLTSEKLTMKTFQIFFGDNLEYVVSLTNVTGEAVSNQ